MEILQDFCQRYYFGSTVKVLPPIMIQQDAKSNQFFVEVTKTNVRQKNTNRELRKVKIILEYRRAHPYDLHKVPEHHRQFAVNQLLTALHHLLPYDAKCLVGLTMEDLYDVKYFIYFIIHKVRKLVHYCSL